METEQVLWVEGGANGQPQTLEAYVQVGGAALLSGGDPHSFAFDVSDVVAVVGSMGAAAAAAVVVVLVAHLPPTHIPVRRLAARFLRSGRSRSTSSTTPRCSSWTTSRCRCEIYSGCPLYLDAPCI
eukprot:COSAG05_NODE_323_length_11408_cov_361.826156_13_plen_126_part_00